MSRSAAPPEPELPPALDDTARRQAREAQAAMRALLARVPEDFAYGEDIDLVFRPDHAR